MDTSVWVESFRRGDSPEARHLRVLLDDDRVALPAPVHVELLVGAPRRQFTALRLSLSALPRLVPERSTWTLVDRWVTRMAGRGERVGMVDLLIGAIAAERQATVWSLDRDFRRLARLDLVTLHDPGSA